MIYVDAPRRWKNRRKHYSHMVSSISIDHLHEFAASIGVKRHWFHKDHYDIREFEYEKAREAGAKLVTSRDIVRIKKDVS